MRHPGVPRIQIAGVNQNSLTDFVNSLQYIGGLLLAVLLVRPEGLIKERPTFALPKKKLKQIADYVAGKGAASKDSGSPPA